MPVLRVNSVTDYTDILAILVEGYQCSIVTDIRIGRGNFIYIREAKSSRSYIKTEKKITYVYLTEASMQ